LTLTEDEKLRLSQDLERRSLLVVELEAEAKPRKVEIKQLSLQLQQAGIEMEKLTAGRDAALEDGRDEAARRGRLEEQNVSLRTDMRKAAEAAASRERGLEATCSDLAVVVDSLKMELHERRGEWEAGRSRLTQEITQLSSRFATATKDLERKTLQVEELKMELKAMQDQLQGMMADRIALEERTATRVRESESKVRWMDEELASLRKEYTMVEERLRDQREECDALEGQMREVAETCNRLMEERRGMLSTRDDFEAEVCSAVKMAGLAVRQSQHSVEVCPSHTTPALACLRPTRSVVPLCGCFVVLTPYAVVCVQALTKKISEAEALVSTQDGKETELGKQLKEALQQIAMLRQNEVDLATSRESDRKLHAKAIEQRECEWELQWRASKQLAEDDRKKNYSLLQDLGSLRQKLLQEEGNRIQLEMYLQKTQRSV